MGKYPLDSVQPAEVYAKKARKSGKGFLQRDGATGFGLLNSGKGAGGGGTGARGVVSKKGHGG